MSLSKLLINFIRNIFLYFNLDINVERTKNRIDKTILSSKPLTAGPFMGEFGWELMQWQGYLRKLSDYDRDIHVICRKNSSFLYEDFAKSIQTFNINSLNPSYYESQNKLKEIKFEILPNSVWLPATNHCVRMQQILQQRFVKLGKKDITKKYDIVIHACRDHKNNNVPGRVWPISNWEKLINLLLKKNFSITSIGTSQTSSHINGTVNNLDISLNETCDVLFNSNMCVGTTSGAMHLAASCGTDSIVWFGNYRDSIYGSLPLRYKHIMNPFSTPVTIIDEYDWLPSSDVVLKQILSKFQM